MSSDPQLEMATQAALQHESWLAFDQELRALEDFLAKHKHTVESFTEAVFSQLPPTSPAHDSVFDIQRKIRAMYRIRDLLHSPDSETSSVPSSHAPARLRRLRLA
jgi:hypothetical protein